MDSIRVPINTHAHRTSRSLLQRRYWTYIHTPKIKPKKKYSFE